MEHNQSMALALAALIAVLSSMLMTAAPQMSSSAAALLSSVGDDVRTFVSPAVWPQVVERVAAQNGRYPHLASEPALPSGR
jgi:hypothetical protein